MRRSGLVLSALAGLIVLAGMPPAVAAVAPPANLPDPRPWAISDSVAPSAAPSAESSPTPEPTSHGDGTSTWAFEPTPRISTYITALVADNYVTFTLLDLTVPFSSNYQRFAVGLGVLSMYLLVVVQVTSIYMRKIPKRWWRAIHVWSYVAVLLTSWHAVPVPV